MTPRPPRSPLFPYTTLFRSFPAVFPRPLRPRACSSRRFSGLLLHLTADATSPWRHAATGGRAMNWIDVNGTSLRYDISGSGKSTLVLVHEMGGALESWDQVVPAV